MRKRLALLGGIVLSALILMSSVGCEDEEGRPWNTALSPDHPMGFDMRTIVDPETGEKVRGYFASTLEDAYVSGEEFFIPDQVLGLQVVGLGTVPFMSSISDPIDALRDEGEEWTVKELYCPGTIMEYVDGYFKSLKSKGLGDFTVYYCGTIVPLQMNREILYYVPAEQLEEYAVLVTAYNEENPKREFPGEFRAANIEYRYNAEERPVYYYVDHVEEGGTIEHIPPEPTREGYEFKGWFTDENGTQAWDFSQPIRTGEQESLKLFARWQKLP